MCKSCRTLGQEVVLEGGTVIMVVMVVADLVVALTVCNVI